MTYLLKAPIPYQSLNEFGEFQFVNEALSELLGYSPKELIGLSFSKLWPEEEQKHFFSKFNELLAHGSILCELPLVHANGTVKQVVLAGRAVPNVASGLKQTFDITDRKLVEGQLLQTRSLLEEINLEQYSLIQKQVNQLLNHLSQFEQSLLNVQGAKEWNDILNQCIHDLASASKVIQENRSVFSY